MTIPIRVERKQLPEVDRQKMLLAMRDIFYGGEFAHWMAQQEVPWGAAKEFDEAYSFFRDATGFAPPEGV